MFNKFFRNPGVGLPRYWRRPEALLAAILYHGYVYFD